MTVVPSVSVRLDDDVARSTAWNALYDFSLGRRIPYDLRPAFCVMATASAGNVLVAQRRGRPGNYLPGRDWCPSAIRVWTFGFVIIAWRRVSAASPWKNVSNT